mmetsp:Transcript_2226/g.5320  ORF Transcript_2226/g.5320 Transcript_2226/m.5320 type:complete len:211 (-) Transcript_2226:1202-1834(-)
MLQSPKCESRDSHPQARRDRRKSSTQARPMLPSKQHNVQYHTKVGVKSRWPFQTLSQASHWTWRKPLLLKNDWTFSSRCRSEWASYLGQLTDPDELSPMFRSPPAANLPQSDCIASRNLPSDGVRLGIMDMEPLSFTPHTKGNSEEWYTPHAVGDGSWAARCANTYLNAFGALGWPWCMRRKRRLLQAKRKSPTSCPQMGRRSAPSSSMR